MKKIFQVLFGSSTQGDFKCANFWDFPFLFSLINLSFVKFKRVYLLLSRKKILAPCKQQLETGLLLSCDIQLILGETRREISSLAVQEEYYTHQICASSRGILSCDKRLILGETGRQVDLLRIEQSLNSAIFLNSRSLRLDNLHSSNYSLIYYLISSGSVCLKSEVKCNLLKICYWAPSLTQVFCISRKLGAWPTLNPY